MRATKEDDEWYRNMPKADLSKRPVQSNNIDMDMSGTFKKLDIDWTTLCTEENIMSFTVDYKLY